jgi:hypothetical protein
MFIWPTTARAASYEMGATVTATVSADVKSAASTEDCKGDPATDPDYCDYSAILPAMRIDYAARRAAFNEFFKAERADRAAAERKDQ